MRIFRICLQFIDRQFIGRSVTVTINAEKGDPVALATARILFYAICVMEMLGTTAPDAFDVGHHRGPISSETSMARLGQASSADVEIPTSTFQARPSTFATCWIP